MLYHADRSYAIHCLFLVHGHGSGTTRLVVGLQHAACIFALLPEDFLVDKARHLCLISAHSCLHFQMHQMSVSSRQRNHAGFARLILDTLDQRASASWHPCILARAVPASFCGELKGEDLKKVDGGFFSRGFRVSDI